jgi:outer membrane lipopolysaccharide assembly protein LptE/RlpB
MKIVELINHIRVPITNEEADVLGKFHEEEIIEKSQLDLREQQIANQLVNKDVLLRKNQDGKITYKKKSR